MRVPFVPVLPIMTERLVLRAFGPDDFKALLRSQSEEQNVRFVPFPPRTPEQVATALQRAIDGSKLAEDGDHLDFAVTLPDGPVVGHIAGELLSKEHQTIELAWMFLPDYSGRGYATESARAVVDLLFRQVRARRLIARIDERNDASRRLAERLGMRAEAHLLENEWIKGELTSEIDYGLLAREWPDA